MRGLRAYFRTRKEARFRESYECLYPLFEGLFYYLYHGDCVFHFPWDDDVLIEKRTDSSICQDDAGALYPVASLIANDLYISDDWNGITLTDSQDLPSNRRVYEALYALPPKPHSFNGRVLFFHNYDGAFWQFFSNDIVFETRMLEQHSGNPDLDLRFVDFKRDYPDPGSYRDQYPPKANP